MRLLPLCGRTRPALVSIPLACALVFGTTAFASSPRTPANGVHWTFLSGSVRAGLQGARLLGPVAAARQMTIAVELKLRNPAALSRLLAAQYDPTSSLYHRFLTPGEFARYFAPTANARAGVRAWLQGGGLRVRSTSGNGLLITAQGSAAAMERIFATPLGRYWSNGAAFTTNSRPLRLPATIGSEIAAVTGLTTGIRERPVEEPRLQSGGVEGLGPSDLASLYDVGPLQGAGNTGAGQTIAIASFADYAVANVAAFDAQFGLTANVTRVKVSDGVTSGAPQGASNGQDEADSDLEILQGVAPAASLLMYEAPNTDAGALNMYNKVVSDNRASVVTTSWGGVESSYPPDELSAIDQALQQGAAQGQAFFAASGDAGAYDGSGSVPGGDTTLAVDFPASDPWITGVGGTSLNANGTQYLGETAWLDSSDPRNPAGSGGGLSSIFARPAYQTGTGVDNEYSNGKRQVPDVAADADPNTGYAVYTVDPHDVARWGVTGGTSVAAPLWAGFAALVNQSLGHRIGFLNPTLYQLGARAATFAQPPFHDVTTGTNGYYPATAGWDFATGWGSFDGAEFVSDVKELQGASGSPPTTATPAVTSTPVPTATPRSTSAPSPVAPSLSIKSVLLFHRVNGKLRATSALKVGETGTMIILIHSSHAGSLSLRGKLQFRQKGKLLEVVNLTSTTYAGKRALTATVRFTSNRRAGTILTRVTVTLGSLSAAVSHNFKVVLAK